MEKMEITDYPEIKRWFSRVKKSSIGTYLSGFKPYLDYTGLNPTELIDEIERDREKPRRERGGVEQRLLEFHKYLTTDFVRRRAGSERKSKGVSSSMAACYLGAIRGFYKANGFPLMMRTPKGTPKKENVKLSLAPKDVKLLVDHAPTLRDRAILLMMFQGGFDVSTICSLNYGDIAREFEAGKIPMIIHVVREKEGVGYYTCVGKETVEVLTAYLKERRINRKLKLSDPLFTLEGAKKLTFERITTNLIQNMLRAVVIKSELVSNEELETADMNPARPHALRSAFSTTLRLNGFNDGVVDFMMGHTVPYNGAYFIPPEEKLREMYKGVESCLSINEVSKTVGALDEKVNSYRGVLEDQRVEIDRLKSQLNEITSRIEHKYEPTANGLSKLLEDKDVKALMVKKIQEDPELLNELVSKLMKSGT